MNRYHLVHRLGFLRRRPRRLRCVGKVFALALLSLPTAADESIRFHHYGARDGLSGEPVYAVLQDREGYVWVGSDGGLDRFDGHRFESFRRTGSQSRHLPADRVLSLAEDSMGRVWAGTNAGPAIYSRELKSFRLLSLPLRADAAGTLPEASVEALFVDRRQTLWIGTDRGLFRLPLTDEPPRGDQIRRGFDGLIAGDPEPPDPRINAFAEDADGRLWIGTRAGLLRISSLDSDPRLDHFVHDPADPQSLHDDEIYALLTDHRGALWIGAWGTGGLGRLDADQLAARRPRFRRFVYPPGDPRGLPLDVVKSLREARDHTLWIGTQEVGQCRLTAEERLRAEPRFHCLAYDPLDPTSAPRSPVGAILQDKQGTLWFGGIGGLARHVPATAKVALVHPRPEPGASARSIQINGVVESRNGPVWVGTGEGLVRLAASDRPGGG
ncbi:MAG: two-component regulator propeller domain-containing protein, partial [Acidobacteriota bacterium]